VGLIQQIDGVFMNKEKSLRILFVEDLPSDMELAARELKKNGLKFTSLRVETKEEFLKALEEFKPEIIISDYALPSFDGMQALQLSKAHNSTIPFIILTGSMNEDTAVECMKSGADDYVIK
jgi:DNA-binding response OmpR family regulator